LTRYRIGEKPEKQILSLKVNGMLPQCAGWRPLFKPMASQALILHFGAPVIPQRIRYAKLNLTQDDEELHLRFVTPGLGEGSFVSIAEEALPKDVHPVAEITWPTDGNHAMPLRTKATLLHRC
jgi:hypothetical protein